MASAGVEEVASGLSGDRCKNFSLRLILEQKSVRPMVAMNWRCELFRAVLLLEKPYDQHKTCMRVGATGGLVGGQRVIVLDKVVLPWMSFPPPSLCTYRYSVLPETSVIT